MLIVGGYKWSLSSVQLTTGIGRRHSSRGSSADHTVRFVGKRVPRVNDRALLSGQARFVDDLHLPGMLHAAVVRSPVAHGILTRFEAGPTDAAVFGPDAFDHLNPLPILWLLGDQWQDETLVVDRHVR